MRRTSAIVVGFDWHECRRGDDELGLAIGAMRARVLHHAVAEIVVGRTALHGDDGVGGDAGATGIGPSARMNGWRGVMLSTALGTRQLASWGLPVAISAPASRILLGMVMRRANWWAIQLPAT